MEVVFATGREVDIQIWGLRKESALEFFDEGALPDYRPLYVLSGLKENSFNVYALSKVKMDRWIGFCIDAQDGAYGLSSREGYWYMVDIKESLSCYPSTLFGDSFMSDRIRIKQTKIFLPDGTMLVLDEPYYGEMAIKPRSSRLIYQNYIIFRPDGSRMRRTLDPA